MADARRQTSRTPSLDAPTPNPIFHNEICCQPVNDYVGVLLVTAMLILPGAIRPLLGRSMGVITLLSLGIALASTMSGLALSNADDVPPGPAIVLTAFALFVAAYLARRHRDQRHSHARLHNSHEHAA